MWVCLHVVHTSHLAPFGKPYIEPQEITLDGSEEIAEPIQVLVWCSKKHRKVDGWVAQ